MEITKGENANLAGMEPRCPKNIKDLTNCQLLDRLVEYSHCDMTNSDSHFVDDFAEVHAEILRRLAGSPAPTPPLDVEGWHKFVMAEFFRPTEDAILAGTCGETWPEIWARIVGPRLIKLGTERRHIASPAPQPPICDGCGAGLMLDRGAFYDCFACGHNREKQVTAAASPAQPEKR